MDPVSLVYQQQQKHVGPLDEFVVVGPEIKRCFRTLSMYDFVSDPVDSDQAFTIVVVPF